MQNLKRISFFIQLETENLQLRHMLSFKHNISKSGLFYKRLYYLILKRGTDPAGFGLKYFFIFSRQLAKIKERACKAIQSLFNCFID